MYSFIGNGFIIRQGYQNASCFKKNPWLLDFTSFNRVLLGFSEIYWVFPGFQWFLKKFGILLCAIRDQRERFEREIFNIKFWSVSCPFFII